MPPNCSEGRGPDLLYRFQIPPFNEPYGEDCYFSTVGYDVLGSIIIIFATVTFLLNAYSSLIEKNSLLRNAKRFSCFVLSVVIGVVIVGWTQPKYFGFAWVALAVVFVGQGELILYIGYTKIVGTIRSVEIESNFKLSSVIGGQKRLIFCTVVLCTCPFIVLGSVIPIAILLLRDPLDNSTISALYRLMCCAIALTVFVGISMISLILDRFTRAIENVRQANIGSVDSGKAYELENIVKRFRFAKKLFWSATPVGVGVWLCQATFLPMFWFIVLIHCGNVVFASIISFYAGTTEAQKKKILGTRLAGTGKTSNGLESGKISSGTGAENRELFSQTQTQVVVSYSGDEV